MITVTVKRETSNSTESGYGVYVNAYVTWDDDPDSIPVLYASECVSFGKNTEKNLKAAERRVRQNATPARRKNTWGNPMVTWSLHPITGSDEEGGTMYALLPDDLADGLLIGEHTDVQAVAQRLNQFLETGIADEPIDEYDPQLAPWLSAREAEETWGIPRATITWACRQGHIVGAEKFGNRWRFPQGRFLAWMHKRKRT